MARAGQPWNNGKKGGSPAVRGAVGTSPENIRGKGSKERKRLVARPGAPPDRYGQAVGALGDVALGDEDRVLDGQGTQLGDD